MGIPQFPHAFWGDVTVRGKPAPVGALVYGLAVGVRYPVIGNPIQVEKEGKLGAGGGFGRKLVVQGPNIKAGAPVMFFVDGQPAEVRTGQLDWADTLAFDAGDVTWIELRVP